jgi:hypothetical protein
MGAPPPDFELMRRWWGRPLYPAEVHAHLHMAGFKLGSSPGAVRKRRRRRRMNYGE